MPIYSVAAPDGNTYDVEGPEGAKDKDIIAAIFAQHPESGKPPSPAKLKERTYSEAFLTDPRAALVSGAGAAVQFPGQIYGLATGDMDTAPMRLGQELQEIGQGMKSKGLLAREAASAKAIQESEKEGQIPAFGTAIMETIKDPALLSTKIIEQIPQLLVPFGGAKLAKGAVAAKAALTGLPLGEAAIGELATKSAIAAAALQQGADVGSDAYKSIYDILIAKGIQPAQAAETAINQARAAGVSGAVISLLVQKIPGARALEETLAGVPGKGGKLGRVVAGTLGGGASESLEESGGQLSKNIAIKDVSPEQSLLQGLGQTAGLAFVPGAGLGLASSMMQKGPATPPQEAVPPEAVPPVQGTPPVTPSPAGPVSPLPSEAPPMLALPAPPGAEPVAPPTDGIPPVTPPEVPPTKPIDFGDYTTGLPKDSEDVFQKMQNRDRTTAASVEQMTGIVGNPDYDRLRVTPDFGSGAPVIISDVKIPTNRMGTIETTTAANGRKIDVQYAVLSAEDIMASNSANGIPNKSYGDINIPGIRAVAGNGRIAGLQGAYEQGNAAEYTRKLLADGQHGIDPEVIKRISNPVLVRVMRQSDITPNIGDISNAPSQLGLNPVEMAKNDQGRIDLAGLQFNEDGSFDKNTLQQFVLAMPQEERGTLLDGEGKANSIARTRLNNAIFYKGYDSESLINLYAQALDSEAANIMRGLSIAASKMARLANAGEYDIRNTVAKATEYAINARRRNISLKDIVAQGDMSMDANTRTVLEMFANNPLSSKKIGESLKRLADAAYEQTKVDVDMFGNVPKVPLDQIFKALQEENPPPGLFDQEEKKEFEISKSAVQIDKELTGKSITDATQWLIDNAPNSVAKYIAQKIDARIKDMVASGVPMDFSILKGAKRSRKAHGSSAINPRGVSGKTEFTVKINGYDAKEFGRGISGTNYSTIMHELLHAATQTDTHMLGKLGLKYGTEISKLYTELTPLLLRIRKQVREDIAAGVNHPFLKEANIAKRHLQNVDELIAYGLTEHAFQDYLKTIKVNAKQNAFTGLITAIRKMLKIESQYQTALEKLAGSVETSLDRKFSELQSDIGKGIGRTLGIKSSPQTSPSKTRREAVELEGKLFGGSYGMVLGGPFAPKGSAKYKMIEQAREQYNAYRVEAGLPEVSDWRKRPEQLMQGLPSRSEAPNTPEFKQLFAGSKVVDKNGEPLLVYHGSQKFEDDQFKPDVKAVNRNGNVAGYYFTPNPEEASDFAINRKTKSYDEGAQVLPVYLIIKNPYVIGVSRVTPDMVNQYRKEMIDLNQHMSDERVKEWAESKIYFLTENGYPSTQALNGDGDAYQRILKAGGYDGFKDGRHWVAFYPNQIKSIFNKKPTTGPKISFSRTAKTNVTKADLGREKTGQLYEVYNRKTGKVVGGPYQTRSAARSGVDRNDNKYGGYAHDVREVQEFGLDEGPEPTKQDLKKAREEEKLEALDAAGVNPKSSKIAKNIIQRASFYKDLLPASGFNRLPIESQRNYKDKSGQLFLTFERDGVRVAFSSGQKLYSDKRGVGVYQGDTNESVFHALIVDPQERKKGKATNALIDIIRSADESNTNIYLQPTSLDAGAMTTPQLVEFYKRFKFEPQNNDKVLIRVAKTEQKPSPKFNLALKNKTITQESEADSGYNPEIDSAEASQETEEPKPRSAESMRKAAQELLQKRKPPPAAMFEGVPEDFIQKARPIFSPERKTILDKIEGMKNGFWQKFAQGTVDSFRTIKEYSQEAYMLARLSKTVDGALHGLLFNGHVFDDGGALNIRPNTKGLIEALKPVGAEVDRYQMYIALNREARLPAHKRSKIAGMQELVDRRDELVNGKINGVPREEVYNKVRQDLNALNKSVLKFALDKGLINSTAKMIADTQARTDIKEDEKLRIITGLQNNPVGYERFANDIYYIPFFREMEDGDLTKVMTASGLTNQHFSKELKGGSAPFGDLMENTLQNWSHILSASMKNQAAAKTIEAAVKLNGAEPNFKPYYYMADGLVHSTSNGKVVGDGELKPWMTTGVGGGKAKVMIDGQPAYFNITDPMLMDSIMSIGYLGPKSAFLDVAKNFKNILQYGVTISPAFKVRNLFRDSISSMAVSDLKKNPFANIVKGWGLSDENNPAHISALAGGGVFNFGTIMEGDQSRLVKKLLARGVPAENILNTPERVKAALAKTWRLYEELGNKSESANRMALYQQMRDKGMSHMEASFHARDLLDFSMHGAWPAMHVVTQTIPFLNARMQGLYKLGRDGINPTARVFYNTITGKPLEQTDIQKATSFTIVSSAVALASLMLYAAFKDDEDFKKRDGWDRDNFWWFKIPGMKHALYIPKPFEIGAFGTIVERTAEQIFDQGAEGKQFEDSLKRMLTDTFAVNFPQIIKPLVDLYSNKDSFTDSPIESAGMERLSKAERITDNTSPLAIALGGISNAVMPKDLVMSPVQMDYAIKGFFGWLGGTAAYASKFAVAPFREGAYPSERWENTVSMGFIRELPATQSGYVTSFYDNAKQISQAYADMRHYAALGESDKVLKILEDKGDKIQLAKFYDKTSKEMAGLRKQIALTYADKDMSGPDKKERIDSLKFLISDVAKQAEDARKSLKN